MKKRDPEYVFKETIQPLLDEIHLLIVQEPEENRAPLAMMILAHDLGGAAGLLRMSLDEAKRRLPAFILGTME